MLFGLQGHFLLQCRKWPLVKIASKAEGHPENSGLLYLNGKNVEKKKECSRVKQLI